MPSGYIVPCGYSSTDDCMDAGGTTPGMGEVELSLEQKSRTTPGAVVELTLQSRKKCIFINAKNN